MGVVAVIKEFLYHHLLVPTAAFFSTHKDGMPQRNRTFPTGFGDPFACLGEHGGHII